MLFIKKVSLLSIVIFLSLSLISCAKKVENLEEVYANELIEYLVKMSAFPEYLGVDSINLYKDNENDIFYYEISFSGRTLDYDNLPELGDYYENEMLYVVYLNSTNKRDYVISQDYGLYPNIIENLDLIKLSEEVYRFSNNQIEQLLILNNE